MAHGCLCRQGFKGKDCLTPSRLAEGIVSDSETNSAGIAWGIILALLAIAAVVLFLFHRRRVHNRKIELADVEFHAHPPQTAPDRHHFDNPVYAFSDNQQLLTNLRPVKPTNLERLRQATAAAERETDSVGSSRGSFFFYIKK